MSLVEDEYQSGSRVRRCIAPRAAGLPVIWQGHATWSGRECPARTSRPSAEGPRPLHRPGPALTPRENPRQPPRRAQRITERGALLVGQHMVLGARSAAVDRARTGSGPPLSERTCELSITAWTGPATQRRATSPAAVCAAALTRPPGATWPAAASTSCPPRTPASGQKLSPDSGVPAQHLAVVRSLRLRPGCACGARPSAAAARPVPTGCRHDPWRLFTFTYAPHHTRTSRRVAMDSFGATALASAFALQAVDGDLEWSDLLRALDQGRDLRRRLVVLE